MKYAISTLQGQTPLLVLNRPVTTYAKQTMVLMYYPIALPAMTKEKLKRCYAIMKAKAVQLLV